MIGLADAAIALVAAHMLNDFVLQRRAWLEREPAGRAGLHAVAYAGLTWLLLPEWSSGTLIATIVLAVAHFGIDRWRAAALWPYAGLRRLSGLLLDQAAHMSVVGLVLLGLHRGGPWSVWASPWLAVERLLGVPWAAELIPTALTLLAAYAFALPGGALIVGFLLEPYAKALPDEEELSLGRVIGYLERLILLTLLLLGQYGAMAVIIAAKSLIRIPSVDRSGEERPRSSTRITTEYFLIGTMGSLIVALFAGLVARAVLL